jgi:hypothetical protein
MSLARRPLLGGGFLLGARPLLTGCDPSDADAVQSVQAKLSVWNDRVQAKLGFKNPKFVTTIYVTSERPRGFRTGRSYNWFSGI